MKIIERPQCVPLTPDIERYKLGRTKPKKKSMAPSPLTPTMQPLSQNNQQSQSYSQLGVYGEKSPKNNMQQGCPRCPNHPDRKVLCFRQQGATKGYCVFCTLCEGGGDQKFADSEKIEKVESIELFKTKVQELKESIREKEELVYEILGSEEEKYHEYLAYMNESFKEIISDLEEKHNELNDSLLESIQKRKKCLNSTTDVMNEIQSSIERYILDINKNYEEILVELSIENFREIMEKYDNKIEYFNSNLQKISQELNNPKSSINIYLPFQELRRVINKANIQFMGLDVSKIVSNRSLEKFNSSGTIYSHARVETKASKLFEKNEKIIIDRHDRKSESKGHKKRNTVNNIHQIRGANKENANYDSYYGFEVQ